MAGKGSDGGREPKLRAAGGAMTTEPWWRSGVLYQVYPRSFSDSDGDGHGDLQGVIDRLDHLAWLGVDAIWLNPIQPSPNADWGYDVADFLDVHPDYGDLATADRLIAEAAARGIRVMLDLVPNHTSDRHTWFLDARSDRASPNRDRYVWADAGPDGSPPNNWRSTFGGPAWTWDAPSGQFYLHNFLAEQPDLNWWSQQVRVGLRCDPAVLDGSRLRRVPHRCRQRAGEGPGAPRQPPRRRRRSRAGATSRPPTGPQHEPTGGARRVAAMAGDHRRARAARCAPGGDLGAGPPLVGGVLRIGVRRVAPGDEHPLRLRRALRRDATDRRGDGGCDPTGRVALVAGIEPRRGEVPDPLGRRRPSEDAERPPHAAHAPRHPDPLCRRRDRDAGGGRSARAFADPVGVRNWPDDPGRDRARTPMQWTGEANGGFTLPGVEPWLPMGDAARCNVADQREDPGSILHLCRDLIALRRTRADLRRGPYRSIGSSPGLWAWARGDRTVVAVNLTDEPSTLDLGEGTVLLGTRRQRDGEAVRGEVRLEPWEGLVVASEVPRATASAPSDRGRGWPARRTDERCGLRTRPGHGR